MTFFFGTQKNAFWNPFHLFLCIMKINGVCVVWGSSYVTQVCRVNVDFWVNCPFKEWLFRVMTLWPGLDFCISDGLSLSSPPLSFWSCTSYTSFSLFAMWGANRHYFRVSFSSEPCIRFIYTVTHVHLFHPKDIIRFLHKDIKRKFFLTPS